MRTGCAARIADYLDGARDRVVRPARCATHDPVFLSNLDRFGCDLERIADVDLHRCALFDYSMRRKIAVQLSRAWHLSLDEIAGLGRCYHCCDDRFRIDRGSNRHSEPLQTK